MGPGKELAVGKCARNARCICSLPQDNLLLYNHARLMAQDNHSKEYLVSIMFSHYDQNNNGNLERDELERIAEREDLEQLSKGCSLGHMISFDDADRDGRLNINEFYLAFSKLYSKLHGNLVFSYSSL